MWTELYSYPAHLPEAIDILFNRIESERRRNIPLCTKILRNNYFFDQIRKKPTTEDSYFNLKWFPNWNSHGSFPRIYTQRILLTTNSNFYSIDFPDLEGTEVLKSIQYKETPRILETSSLRLNEFQSVNIVSTHFFMSHRSWKDDRFWEFWYWKWKLNWPSTCSSDESLKIYS